MKFIDENYVTRIDGKAKKPPKSVCLFCASKEQITREHLIKQGNVNFSSANRRQEIIKEVERKK